MTTNKTCAGLGRILVVLLLATACSENSSSPAETAARTRGAPAGFTELAADAAGVVPTAAGEGVADWIDELAKRAESASAAAAITVDDPLDESVFPPDFLPPTILWHDAAGDADLWLIAIEFPEAETIRVLVPGEPPPVSERDARAGGSHEPTPYQRSARSWTPTRPVWEEIKRRSSESTATLTFTGFARSAPEAPLSRGAVRISTSKDPVGAPIFYRDVPLMPGEGEKGKIKPLAEEGIPLIAWRLRDVSRPESKVVLTGMPSCGNCHSFSLDGKTLGMDVDGPDGDKGMYALMPVSKNMVIERDDVLTWNSFTDKPEGHRTIGFLSRVSPDGQHVVSTVNESVYVANFMDHRFLQVFFPTRGILAVYSRKDRRIRALPGADDTEYVHCDGVWSPDGKVIVFARARAFDPQVEGKPMATYANDPNEPKIQYDLYRIPFNDGAGGTPVPIEGASGNGMSNTFPKVSPDGKWIVFVKCKNGQLMRPDSRLWIVPFEGGEAREMRCNTSLMNSWHSFSPNGRWMVFSSKSNTPYTQAFLTHIDEEGNDSPAILVPNSTASNRAVNLPEFVNAPYDAIESIETPVVDHYMLFLRGIDLHNRGEHEAAIHILEEVVEADPEFHRAFAAIGAAYYRMERYPEAIVALEKAIEAGSRTPFTRTNLAYAHLHGGSPDRALAVFEETREIAPTFPPVYLGLGLTYRRTGQIEEAVAAYEKVVELVPHHDLAHFTLHRLYRSLGDDRRAVEHLTRAVELVPGNLTRSTELAWVLATSHADDVRDGKRAVALARKAVEQTEGKRPEPLDALAAALAETGRFEEAAEVAQRALRLAREIESDRTTQIETRRKLYLERKPYRESVDR
jgi:tetratricopeptide (TPR) repeat protein